MGQDYYSKKGGCDLKAMVIAAILGGIIGLIMSLLE